MDWNEELIVLMAEFGGTRLARHAHLPLAIRLGCRAQAHAPALSSLALCRKGYGAPARRRAGADPGADVMVGFPGETDSEFTETLEMVRTLPFGYLHLFPFSPRPGTRAKGAARERPVQAELVEERMAVLASFSGKKM